MSTTDKPEQLTFSDDPMLNELNFACKDIEEGSFRAAAERLDRLMDVNPDYPGLAAGYRAARFWLSRTEETALPSKGKKTADYLMSEWEAFEKYAQDKAMTGSAAFKAAMHFVYHTASENYRLAFMLQEDTSGNFDLLLNLGSCFLRLGDYQKTVETLEYAAKSYNPNAKLLVILAEAYYHLKETSKSLLYFREAFFISPSDIDLDIITAEPIVELAEHIRTVRPDCLDVREWIAVYGFITGTLYVRKNVQNKRQVDMVKEQCYKLELSYQRLGKDQLNNNNVLPRLLARYLWLLDYFEFQENNYRDIEQIRDRLLQIDKPMFEDFLRKSRK